MDKKRLIIIDGNAVIHRAFHALPPLKTEKGELVNAIYGFLLVFLRAVKEFKPDFIAAVFDTPGPNFRHYKYKLYKANRPKTPDELCSQLKKIKEVLKNFNVEVFEKEGFEADDIIGAISRKASKKQIYPEIETIILSGDLDTLSMVDKNTKAYILRKGVKDIILYDEQKVEEKYDGLLPNQLTDLRALRGDASDNIPGVFGIGEKTAISLIKKFKTLENIYEELRNNTEESKEIKPAVRQKLIDYKDQAFVSKTLAEIRYDAPVDFDLKKCGWKGYDREKIIKMFEDYNFKSLIPRLSEKEVKAEKKNLSLW